MSDEQKAGASEATQEQPQKTQEIKETKTEQSVNDVPGTDLTEVKSYFKELLHEELGKKDKEIAGLNRRITDQVKTLKEYEREKMTAEEKEALERKEFMDEKLNFFKLKHAVDFPNVEAEDRDRIINYIYGSNEDEIKGTTDFWKEIVDKAVKTGIEKGIEERLKQGYRPLNASGSKNTDNYTDMSKEELTSAAIKASKMPDSEEKTILINKLNNELNLRMRGV
jgi:hypothetical protein